MLIEEFLAVTRSSDHGQRLLDGVIILGEKKQRLPRSSRFDLDDRDVIIIQTKNRRLGMALMGQTLFSAQLIRRFFNPRSVQSIALCSRSDDVLQPMLEVYEDCKVVVCPPEICQVSTR